MPCNCGSAAAKREMIRTARATPTRDGGYLLSSYDGCTTLYRGPLEGESVYVVGRNTPDEKLFKRNMLAEATDYTIEHRASIENIPIVGLCAEAIADLYAGV